MHTMQSKQHQQAPSPNLFGATEEHQECNGLGLGYCFWRLSFHKIIVCVIWNHLDSIW